MRTIALILAAILGAKAGDWRLVMTAGNGTATLIDGSSIRREGPLLTFWQKTLHPDGTTEGARIRIDCETSTWQLIYQQITDARGRVISTVASRLKPQDIRPGSAMEEEQSKLCRVLLQK